jgi:hypothetical protein
MWNRQKILARGLAAVLLVTFALPRITAQGAEARSNAGDSTRTILQPCPNASPAI